MLKRAVIVSGIVVALAIIYWLVSPLFIDRQVNEDIGDIPGAPTDERQEEPTASGDDGTQEFAVISSGAFAGRAGHVAEGTATLLRSGDSYYLRFEEGFRVTNGPDLFVHFGRDGSYTAGARIAALKGNMGGQNYEIPSAVDPTEFNEIWIWCRAFSVPFGVARLE